MSCGFQPFSWFDIKYEILSNWHAQDEKREARAVLATNPRALSDAVWFYTSDDPKVHAFSLFYW